MFIEISLESDTGLPPFLLLCWSAAPIMLRWNPADLRHCSPDRRAEQKKVGQHPPMATTNLTKTPFSRE